MARTLELLNRLGIGEVTARQQVPGGLPGVLEMLSSNSLRTGGPAGSSRCAVRPARRGRVGEQAAGSPGSARPAPPADWCAWKTLSALTTCLAYFSRGRTRRDSEVQAASSAAGVRLERVLHAGGQVAGDEPAVLGVHGRQLGQPLGDLPHLLRQGHPVVDGVDQPRPVHLGVQDRVHGVLGATQQHLAGIVELFGQDVVGGVLDASRSRRLVARRVGSTAIHRINPIRPIPSAATTAAPRLVRAKIISSSPGRTRRRARLYGGSIRRPALAMRRKCGLVRSWKEMPGGRDGSTTSCGGKARGSIPFMLRYEPRIR